MKNNIIFFVVILLLFSNSCGKSKCSIDYDNQKTSLESIVNFLIEKKPPKPVNKNSRGSMLLYKQHLGLNDMFPKVFEDVLYLEVFDDDRTIFFFSKPCLDKKENTNDYEVVIWSKDSVDKFQAIDKLIEIKKLKPYWYSAKFTTKNPTITKK